MKGMTPEAMAAACGGRLLNCTKILGQEVTAIVTDSRKITPGCAFVAIKGERADGHAFVKNVLAEGAMLAIVEKMPEDVDAPCILVDTTLLAIQRIAGLYRENLGIPVVGVTGSVGKTSTKEAIASVLSQKYRVLKTAGNFNNNLGLPLTVFRLTEEDEIAVLEMGISHFGEMEELARTARPDVMVVTNIGTCHLEFLGSRDGVFRAKTACFPYVREGGEIILNYEDDKLSQVTVEKMQELRFQQTSADTSRNTTLQLASTDSSGNAALQLASADSSRNTAIRPSLVGISRNAAICGASAETSRDAAICVASVGTSRHVALQPTSADFQEKEPPQVAGPTFYGLSKGAAVYAKDVDAQGLSGTSFTICMDGRQIPVRLALPGRHMVLNALAAAAVGRHFGLSDAEIAEGIASLKPLGGRVNILKTPYGTVIDDCYNASPASVKAALDLLASVPGRKTAILGDMGELGSNERALHREVGEYAGKLPIDTFLLAGHLSLETAEGIRGVRSDAKILHLPDTETLRKALTENLEPGGSILVKASHFMGFERVVKELQK